MHQHISVYKVFRLAEWIELEGEGTFQGSTDDLRDGFIHLSTEAQLSTTLSKHFSGVRPLVVAEVKVEGLASALRWEASSNGTLYPHLYAPLHRGQVLSHYRVEREA